MLLLCLSLAVALAQLSSQSAAAARKVALPHSLSPALSFTQTAVVRLKTAEAFAVEGEVQQLHVDVWACEEKRGRKCTPVTPRKCEESRARRCYGGYDGLHYFVQLRANRLDLSPAAASRAVEYQVRLEESKVKKSDRKKGLKQDKKRKDFEKKMKSNDKRWNDRKQWGGDDATPFTKDLQSPLSVFDFPRGHLDELSGVTYDKKKKGLYMIEDNTSILSFFDLKKRKVVEEIQIFPEGHDYEDVAIDEKGTVYVLISNGDVLVKEANSMSWQHLKLSGKVDGHYDFEGLVYDKSRHGLLLLSKMNAGDDREIFRYDLISGKLELDFVVALKDIKKVLNEPEVKEFNPAAIALKEDGRIYMVASSGQLLVVLDAQRKVETAAFLPRRPYVQPEGLTFAGNAMIVASEGRGKEGGPGVGRLVTVAP